MPKWTRQASVTQDMLGIQKTPETLENVENFSNVCRTCATITEFVVPIFGGEGLQNSLADKIHKHLPIQVSEQDVLPRVVCYQCASTLLAWHELVACCEQADTALRSRLARAQRPPVSAQESEPAAPQPTSSTGEDSQTKSGVTDGAPASPPARLTESDYAEHVTPDNSTVLLRCEECNKFINQKDFTLHVTLHAAQYTTDGNLDVNVQHVENRQATDGNRSQSAQTLQPIRSPQPGQPARQPKSPQPANLPQPPDRQHNEFSDHSDTELDFQPLPTSVFEAIEDTQCSTQPADEEPVVIEIEDDSDTGTRAQEQKVKSHKRVRTCPFCAKVYTASSSYFYHLKHFHNKSKDHECDLCGKKFGAKASLVQHKLLHTGERKQCETCNKLFTSKASLYIHQQVHKGDKKWACKQCDKAFRWRVHLQRHMSRHAVERCHVCPVCRLGFNVRCDLQRHVRTHTAGNYVCHKCDTKFAQLRYLKVHTERKHPEVVAETQVKVSEDGVNGT